MNIRQIAVGMVLLFLPTLLSAQTQIEKLFKEGIAYHDNGDYENAIASYQKALALDPKSTLINAEIALSYNTMKDYDNAIKHADLVLKQKSEHLVSAYLTKGAALNALGKAQESTKTLEKAIKKTDGHYLLHYNLAINYYQANDLDQSEEQLLKGLGLNQSHPGSHFLLSNIHSVKGNKVQALLAAHYFLILESTSPRSKAANAIIQKSFGGNVSKDAEKPNTINISLTLDDSNEFSTSELMLSMIEASRQTEEHEHKSDDEWNIERTTLFFTSLGELNATKSKSIWTTLYIPLFYDLAKSDHMEAFCKYITRSSNEASQLWLSENEEKLSNFATWLQGE